MCGALLGHCYCIDGTMVALLQHRAQEGELLLHGTLLLSGTVAVWHYLFMGGGNRVAVVMTAQGSSRHKMILLKGWEVCIEGGE